MATQGGPSGRELDQQVLQCLEATLSPEEGRRRAAEEQLKTLYNHPGEFRRCDAIVSKCR